MFLPFQGAPAHFEGLCPGTTVPMTVNITGESGVALLVAEEQMRKPSIAEVLCTGVARGLRYGVAAILPTASITGTVSTEIIGRVALEGFLFTNSSASEKEIVMITNV